MKKGKKEKLNEKFKAEPIDQFMFRFNLAEVKMGDLSYKFIEYKGYYSNIYYNPETKLFYGKIEFIKDLVNYEGHDADSVLDAFHKAVDDYIADCEKLGEKPEKPFKGSFNVSIAPELHKKASLYALEYKKTLNELIEEHLTQLVNTQNTNVVLIGKARQT
jgi:predicted HicB family RNase H-like nuclease